MSAEDYHILPTFMQEKNSRCEDHQKKFEFYCSFHACPCCVHCITDEHQKCQDLKPLSDIIKQVKSSASVQLLEKDLKDVRENLDTAIKYMKTRIGTINSQKTKAVEEIRNMRKSINDYLNKLEQNILSDLESKHSKLKINIATVIQEMEQRFIQINQMQNEFTKMAQHATEQEMYFGLIEIEKTSSQTAKYIDDLESGDHFVERNLEVNISSAFQSVLSLGEICINSTSSTLQIKAGRKDQAQHLSFKCPGIKKIKPSFVTRLTIPNDMKTVDIYACRILLDGKFIILDYSEKQLLLFNNDGMFIRIVVTFKEFPIDVCFVKNNTVAVTLGSAQQATLVDIKKKKLIQTIKLSHYCYGVASDGENLVISSNDRQCTRVNLNEKSQIFLEGMEGVGRISLFQGNIYGTNTVKSKICCCDSTGKPLCTLRSQVIRFPVGITLDINGFVYIASLGNYSIVVLSPDVKTYKTILSEAHGIKSLSAIDINRETGIMIVSSKINEDNKTDYKTAFVYEI